MSLIWDVSSDKLGEPMKFSLDVCSQVLSRSYVRQTSMFAALWQSVRIIHSTTAIFSVSVRPAPVKRVGDLWRMNTQHDYVKGEEELTNWTPRGVSLVHDFINAKKQKQRLAELEAVKAFLSPEKLTIPNCLGIRRDDHEEFSANQKALLTKFLNLWSIPKHPVETLLRNSNTEPPANGAAEPAPRTPRLTATVAAVPKNATVLKGGYLLTPSADSTRWIRRFVELRRPYLHIHSITDGEEVNIVSLRNSRIDHQPQIAKLLKRDGKFRKETVFAIYGTDNTWLFAARNEREKVEWIFKIDQAYFGGGSGSGDDADGGDIYDDIGLAA
jgi:kinesin family protein 1